MQEEHRASDSGGVVPQEDVLLRREQGRDEDAQPRRQAHSLARICGGWQRRQRRAAAAAAGPITRSSPRSCQG